MFLIKSILQLKSPICPQTPFKPRFNYNLKLLTVSNIQLLTHIIFLNETQLKLSRGKHKQFLVFGRDSQLICARAKTTLDGFSLTVRQKHFCELAVNYFLIMVLIISQ